MTLLILSLIAPHLVWYSPTVEGPYVLTVNRPELWGGDQGFFIFTKGANAKS